MKTIEHTSGPFTHDGLVISGPSTCFEVATIHRAETVVEMLNRGWNGGPVRAAAPELLTALEMALSSILTAEELDGLDGNAFSKTKAAIRAAIAKATNQ